MPNNSLSGCDSQSVLVNRRLGQLNEPMRTRVKFYLAKLQARKASGEVLTQDDFDRSIGRAFQDTLDDQAVAFDKNDIQAALEGVEADKTVSLQDVVNGCSR